MKYAILEKGFGEGCDYTIGCNMRWKIIEFDGDIEDLKHKCTMYSLFGGDANADPKDYSRIDDMSGQSSELIIIPITEEITIDLDRAREEHNDRRDEEARQKEEERDRKEFERLKEKFEGEKNADE